MKIVLVQPPIEDFYFTPHRSSSLGLHSLAQSWFARGHNCQIINFPGMKPKGKKIPLPANLDYLRPYLKKLPPEAAGTSYFKQYYRFGPTLEECVDLIAEFRADIVAVSCFAWCYAQSTVKLLKYIKKYMGKDSPLLVTGGAGVTAMPEYFINSANIIFTGEGEKCIEEIEKKVHFKNYSFPGEITACKPPDEIPFSSYFFKNRKNHFFATTMLTRGCPKMCRFCSNYLVFGKDMRKVNPDKIYRGIDNIFDRIEHLSETDDSGERRFHINFEDDNILFQKQYFISILKHINSESRKRDIKFSFSVENGLDYLLLDTDTLIKFRDLNITQLNLSMASMNIRQLEAENRKGINKKLEAVIKQSKSLKIPVITYFICGLKGDTPDSAVDTIKYLHKLDSSIGISLYYPVPGLPDWQDRKIFLNHYPGLSCGSSAWPWNKTLSTKELITAFRLARTSNLIKTLSMGNDQIGKLKCMFLEDNEIDHFMINRFFRET